MSNLNCYAPTTYDFPITRFIWCYTLHLEKAIKENPSAYTLISGPLDAETIATKMTIGLSKGTANKNTPSIKATCKDLGIKFTYKAIQEYLKGGNRDQQG